MAAISDLNLSNTNPIVPLIETTQYSGFGASSKITQQFAIWCGCDGVIDDSGLKDLPDTRVMPCTGLVLLKNPTLNIRQRDPNCCIADVSWDALEGRITGTDPIKNPGELISVSFGSQGRQATVATSFQSRSFSNEEDGSEILFGQPIVDDDCKVTGCPVTLPRKQYCESYCVSRAFVDKNFCRNIDLSIGTLNVQPFRDCDPCEMMLTSVQGNRTTVESDWTFDFCWEIAQNFIIGYSFFDGFTNPSDPNSDLKPFVEREISVGGFNHLLPKTHTYTRDSGKIVVLEALEQHNPHRKTDYAANLGLPA